MLYVKEIEKKGDVTITSIYRFTIYIKEYGLKEFIKAVKEGRAF